MSRGWAVEGASPYNSVIMASPEHGRTLFAPTDVCGVIKGCEINNNAKCQRRGGLSRAPAPTFDCYGLLCRKIAVALCGGALCRRIVKRCRLVLRFCVCDRRKFDVLLFLPAPLDRLTPNEALPQTPQGTLSLDPASPLTPGLSLRFIYRYARCCLLLHSCAQLWSAFLIPHSSFLIPHFDRFTA